MAFLQSISPAPIAVATIAIAPSMAAAQQFTAPAEGSLERRLFGAEIEQTTGIKFDGYAQVGFVRNDSTTSLQRDQGLSNYPIAQASDEGLIFNAVQMFLHRDIAGNILPHSGPRRTPKAEEISWGFMVETMYGRNGQAARSFGFDESLGINHPGDQNASQAAASFQNFFAVPNFNLQLALPYGSGEVLTIGRFGAGVGYEIPVQTKASSNFFYSRSYAFVASPNQVTGVLLSTNLGHSTVRSLVAEIGVVNGWQNWHDNNGQKSLLAAIRWRSADFKNGANLALLTGDEQNQPGTKPQLPNNRVLAASGQRRSHLALNGFHDIGAMRLAAELYVGRQEGDGLSTTILLGPGGGPGFRGATYYGADVHLEYQLSARLTFGVRGEHLSDPKAFALYPTTSANGNFDVITFGAHYEVNSHLRLRPEIRHDKQSNHGALLAFGGGRSDHQTMIAVDALVYF